MLVQAASKAISDMKAMILIAALAGCLTACGPVGRWANGEVDVPAFSTVPATNSGDSGGFLKPGYSIQPGANGGFNVYDSQGYRGTMDANGYYDNQGEGYTPWNN
jgi:hypothetical protein